ncbi:MAG: class I SAM-dependent methyltransferase [Caldilineales bacterium]|nr:class I SAM-dependent methyltransferase [Caldilineales bacterium]
MKLFASDLHFRQPGQHEIWQCRRCGLGITQPPWDETNRAAAYPADYACYHRESRAATGVRASLAAAVLGSMGYPQPGGRGWPGWVTRPLATVRAWSWQPPPPPPGRLLDVGCGSGAYGASMMRLGWQVDGIEPDAGAAELARQAGLRVQTGDILDIDLPESTYDVITFWHVLEHIDDPVAALQHVRSALRPGGLLIVESPNWNSATALLAGRYWFHLDAPRHRVHFTPRSLRRALAAAGFGVTDLSYPPNPHGLAGAIGYRWGDDLRWSWPVQGAGWLAGITTAALGRGDILRATAIAVK